MADNILIRDANGVVRTMRTTSDSDIHTPHQIVEGPLTDEELRASALSVIGPITDAELRASAVSVTGPVTDAQMRANPISVTGPLTNTQLRASAVPVSGPLTNAELRASPVPIGILDNYPVSSGVFSVGSDPVVSINIPAGSRGVRIYPRGADVRFDFDGDPVNPAEDTLGAGGIAKANVTRELLFGAVTTFRLVSTDTGSDATPVLCDVEFFGPGA